MHTASVEVYCLFCERSTPTTISNRFSVNANITSFRCHICSSVYEIKTNYSDDGLGQQEVFFQKERIWKEDISTELKKIPISSQTDDFHKLLPPLKLKSDSVYYGNLIDPDQD